MGTKEKIFAYSAVFFLLAVIITAGVLTSIREREKTITALELTGCTLLSVNDYLRFTELTSKQDYEKLKLSEIKKKFDSHPYVFKSDVIRRADNSVLVELTEKEIIAQTIREKSLYLVTAEREMIRLINGTTRVDYPVISNLPDSSQDPADVMKLESELRLGVNIVNAIASHDNPAVKLAEVDLRKGNEIIVHLENFPAFIKLGRGNYPVKIASLIKIVTTERLKTKLENALYLDARYSERIFIGNYEDSKVAI